MVEAGKTITIIALKLKRTITAVRGRLGILKVSLRKVGRRPKPAGITGGLSFDLFVQADKSGQSLTRVTTVALVGSGASDCRNVTTSSLTHSSTARASAGLSGSWLASMKACRRCHCSIFIRPSPHFANHETGLVRLIRPDLRSASRVRAKPNLSVVSESAGR